MEFIRTPPEGELYVNDFFNPDPKEEDDLLEIITYK